MGSNAHKQAPEFQKHIKSWTEQLHKDLAEKNEKETEEARGEGAKEVSDKIKWTRSIVKYGGPWEMSEGKAKVDELPDSEQRPALLCQIKFHTFVAGAKGPQQLFH